MTVAIIPAYRERADDLLAVLAVARRADLKTILVLQGPLDHYSPEALSGVVSAANTVLHYDTPLGKGGAVKRAWRTLPAGTAVLVLDGDLFGLEELTVRKLADLAEKHGIAARTVYDSAGRLGRIIPALLAAWGVDWPERLEHGGLMAPCQAYPGWVREQVDLDTIPDGYGFDLALALDIHATGMPLEAVPGGRRLHRPGDRAHLERMTHALLDVIMERSSAWSG